jgi:predicted Zn-dependent protease
MSDNTRREGAPASGESSVVRESRWPRRPSLSEEAKERFGKAVDLYNNQRYAEALAIFDSFVYQFPGNPEIEQARAQCLSALKRGRIALPETMARAASDAKLEEAVIKRIILEKMLYDSSGAVQLEAAKLAAEILGLTSTNSREKAISPVETSPEGTSSEAQAAPASSDEIPAPPATASPDRSTETGAAYSEAPE